jgi:mono/diheme cytochrome c family protein
MKPFLAGLILGLLVIPVGAYLYFTGGHAPVATADQSMPFEKWLAHQALHARISKEAPQTVPMEATEANLAAGAHVYQQQCVVCHGLPRDKMTAIATGMFPRPPQLFNGEDVTDDPPGVTYWKVANGIRLTGMPAFRNSLTEEQLWQVSLFLAKADQLPASVSNSLAQ